MHIFAHNPGNWAVKDVLDGRALPAYPAVIAPRGHSESLNIVRDTDPMVATIRRDNGTELVYEAGVNAQRHPLAVRQITESRLDEESILYRVLIQVSARRANLNDPFAVITALPVSWRRNEQAEGRMREHLTAGLGQLGMCPTAILVQSEVGALVYHEILDDQGRLIPAQRTLAQDLVAVADLGGGTVNRALYESLRQVSDSAASPLLGTRRAIEQLANGRGISLVDAEADLRRALAAPGRDALADQVLTQYREAVIAELQQAWAGYRPAAYLFGGGPVAWFTVVRRKLETNLLIDAFGSDARIVGEADPQLAVARGLARYGLMKHARGELGVPVAAARVRTGV